MQHEKREIIQRGAEALIYLRGSELVKERISKGYRVPELDVKIRRQRTRAEAKLMERAKANGVSVPKTHIENDFMLIMERVKGPRLKDALNAMEPEQRSEVCEKIGRLIAKLHAAGIVHGDLTTSNMLLAKDEVFLIDFGLGKFSSSAEDQAVDLFLLYEALKATHFAVVEECWKAVVKAYEENYAKAHEVLARIEKIKNRRRYK